MENIFGLAPVVVMIPAQPCPAKVSNKEKNDTKDIKDIDEKKKKGIFSTLACKECNCTGKAKDIEVLRLTIQKSTRES